MDRKHCQVCDTTKDLSEFQKDIHKGQGVQSRCRECNNAATQEQRRRRRRFVYDYLLEHPCPCGESDPVVLEFNHIDPSTKLANISTTLSQCWGIDKIKEEILKCEVLCANCHRRKTAQQFGHYARL
jgi:hypothetical protein